MIPSQDNDSDIYFMSLALEQALLAAENGDVPIGSVIVKNNEVISTGYNQVELSGNPLAHAEIIAIQNAVKYTGFKYLLDCKLYITLEPCSMCSGAIVLARIPELIFAAVDPKAGASGSLYEITEDKRLNHRCKVTKGVLQEESSLLIKNFFSKLRLSDLSKTYPNRSLGMI